MPCPFIEGKTEFDEIKCRYEEQIDEIKFGKEIACIGGCCGDYKKCDVYRKYAWSVS